jgi:L-aspartate oxidase
MSFLPRFVVDVDLKSAATEEFDILIIGSGVAGLYAALKAARHGRVGIVTKEEIAQGSTPYAQGGIAAALCPQDSPAMHLQDTMVAGAGLCSREAVSLLVTEGPGHIRELIRLGAQFDMEGGRLVLGKEGAHGVRRIVHAQGDATGREVERALVEQVRNSDCEVLERVVVADAVTVDGRCCGAVGFDAKTGEPIHLRAKATILATGGAGQLYSTTTNPSVCTGDGIALAYRAGARVADLEFVQFHPTALAVDIFPKFLISEAVRGEGALLLNEAGERFMPRYDERAELAPRDIVTRAIWEEARRTGTDHVQLDLTAHPRDAIRERFPMIYQTCLEHGIDMAERPIPVYPTAHYLMGGVKTDLRCHTGVEGLLACGEVACTGVHGANRLASNSMLEGLVFGARAAGSAGALCRRELPEVRSLSAAPRAQAAFTDCRDALRRLMWDDVGIVRSGGGLARALGKLGELLASQTTGELRREAVEQANMVLLAALIARAALVREESRGAHYRQDFPETDGANWQGRLELSPVPLDETAWELEPEQAFVPERG